MVGDRPDSDIEGANRAGIDSLLVFTGVVSPRQALALPPEQRPTYLGWSLAALTETHPEHTWNDAVDRIECGGWTAALDGKDIRLSGQGAELDAWRALCELSWAAADMTDRGKTSGELTANKREARTAAVRASSFLEAVGCDCPRLRVFQAGEG
jgi:hypothetical protein